MKAGFIGLGVMGLPMALNLAQGGVDLTVWNRSAGKDEALRLAGARVVGSVAEVFAAAETVVLMLANEAAVDEVLARGTAGFAGLVAGHTVVTMGTTSPGFSHQLGADVVAAGGRYVEAPVSGSRKPAEDGQLVAMLAGEPHDVARVAELVGPTCKAAFPCGPVPNALLMKLAVNSYLITMVTGLCEAAHFAERQGLDLALLERVIAAGPMASAVSGVKMAKLAAGDFAVQAALPDVHMNTRLVTDAARAAGVAAPLAEVCRALFAEADGPGMERVDMVGVMRAIAARDPATPPR